PVVVGLILLPHGGRVKQAALVSWAGMRGAASIVFAIIAVVDPAVIANDIFHIVFFIVLFSILIQGTLLPFMAKILDMIEDNADLMKTFTDYTEEVPIQFIQFKIEENHPWAGKFISQILLPPDSILVLLMRGEERIVPNGRTRMCVGDTLILSGKAMGKIEGINLYERDIDERDSWKNKMIKDIPSGESLIIMIRRGRRVIIPKGNTLVRENDILVINDVK
ncbi:MAG: cation:proton antiporter, partial [Firmicutes bacterium]|nr:cation:proton antiporter [Bacillota bacterium]